MHGENKGRGPLFEYMCRIGLFFFFNLRLFSAFLPHFLSPNPQWLLENFSIPEDPDVSFLPSQSHWEDRKHQVWNVSVCPPPLSTHLLSGSFHPCLPSQGNYPLSLVCWTPSLLTHPDAQPRPQFLTEDGVLSYVPSWVINKEQFSQVRSAQLKEDFRTKRKRVYSEERAKEPWKENLRCLCLCHYIKI